MQRSVRDNGSEVARIPPARPMQDRAHRGAREPHPTRNGRWCKNLSQSVYFCNDFRRQSRPRACAAAEILGVGHRLKVFGIHACRVPAEMVELQPRGDRPEPQFIGDTVRQKCPSPSSLLPIATVVQCPLPNPARATEVASVYDQIVNRRLAGIVTKDKAERLAAYPTLRRVSLPRKTCRLPTSTLTQSGTRNDILWGRHLDLHTGRGAPSPGVVCAAARPSCAPVIIPKNGLDKPRGAGVTGAAAETGGPARGGTR